MCVCHLILNTTWLDLRSAYVQLYCVARELKMSLIVLSLAESVTFNVCSPCLINLSSISRVQQVRRWEHTCRWSPVTASYNISHTHYSVIAGSRIYNQNPTHQFPRSKSMTSWRGQKSVVSVVSCRFTNSITTTCCGLVGRVANKSVTSWQLPQLRGIYKKHVCNGFWSFWS